MAAFVEKGGLYDHFLTSLEPLPPALNRIYTLMADLDVRVDKLQREIVELEADLMRVAGSISREERRERVQKIDSLHQEIDEISEDKFQLSNQSYELVDKHVRRMDKDLQSFEDEVKRRYGDLSVLGVTDQAQPVNGAGAVVVHNPLEASKTKPDRRKKWGKRRKVKTAANASVVGAALSVASAVAPVGPGPSGVVLAVPVADQFDMPVGPNEPTYCICNQVSFGEMIGCENNQCPIEWFHFPCMNLTVKPKGKWWCPTCAPKFDPEYGKKAAEHAVQKP